MTQTDSLFYCDSTEAVFTAVDHTTGNSATVRAIGRVRVLLRSDHPLNKSGVDLILTRLKDFEQHGIVDDDTLELLYQPNVDSNDLWQNNNWFEVFETYYDSEETGTGIVEHNTRDAAVAAVAHLVGMEDQR
jgi:hypothetical protein